MKLHPLFLSVLFLSTPLLAQQQWALVPPFQVWANDIAKAQNGDLLLVSDYALYRFSISAMRWNKIASLTGTLLRISDNSILLGSFNGVSRSTDHGSSFTQSNLDSGRISSLVQLSNGVVLAGSDSRGIYRSTNMGIAWSSASTQNVNTLASIGTITFAGTRQGVK